ncbi:MAG: GIY-YIG nuclease family protein [Candidatus Omnitrophota bacterium]
MWYLYIVKCKDSSLYTGISKNVKDRVLAHNNGKGSKYTRNRKPVELIYTEEFGTKSEALKREIGIKKLSAKNKDRLVRKKEKYRLG